MCKPNRIRRWGMVFGLVSGSFLFQTVTCAGDANKIMADFTAGLSSAIVNNFISLWFADAFNVPTTGIGGLGT